MAKVKLEKQIKVKNESFADKADVIQNINEVEVATVSKVFNGIVVAKTAKSGDVLEIIIEVSGVYNDFELNDKVEIKK